MLIFQILATSFHAKTVMWFSNLPTITLLPELYIGKYITLKIWSLNPLETYLLNRNANVKIYLIYFWNYVGNFLTYSEVLFFIWSKLEKLPKFKKPSVVTGKKEINNMFFEQEENQIQSFTTILFLKNFSYQSIKAKWRTHSVRY